MLNKLSHVAAAAMLALAPMSASALSADPTFTYLYEEPESEYTWLFSDGLEYFNLLASNISGSYEIFIQNDVSDNLRYVFNVIDDDLPSAVISQGTSPKFGETSVLSISYDADFAEGIRFTLEAVPVPAAALLMLTALGGLAVSRRRPGAAAKASA